MQQETAGAALLLQDGSLGIRAGPTLLTEVPDSVFQSPLSEDSRACNSNPGANGDGQGALLGIHSAQGKSSCSDHVLGQVLAYLVRFQLSGS